MRRFLLLVFILLGQYNIYAQNKVLPLDSILINLEYMNQYDSLGLKTGFWYEFIADGNVLSIYYYKDGKKNGISRTYNNFYNNIGRKKEFHLACMGCFINDIPTFEWQFFKEDGSIDAIYMDLKPNIDFKKNVKEAGYTISPDQTLQCYCIIYYNNGKIKSEGWLVIGDATEEALEHNVLEVGIWKYYDIDGNISKNNFDSRFKYNLDIKFNK